MAGGLLDDEQLIRAAATEAGVYPTDLRRWIAIRAPTPRCTPTSPRRGTRRPAPGAGPQARRPAFAAALHRAELRADQRRVARSACPASIPPTSTRSRSPTSPRTAPPRAAGRRERAAALGRGAAGDRRGRRDHAATGAARFATRWRRSRRRVRPAPTCTGAWAASLHSSVPAGSAPERASPTSIVLANRLILERFQYRSGEGDGPRSVRPQVVGPGRVAARDVTRSHPPDSPAGGNAGDDRRHDRGADAGRLVVAGGGREQAVVVGRLPGTGDVMEVPAAAGVQQRVEQRVRVADAAAREASRSAMIAATSGDERIVPPIPNQPAAVRR